MWTDSITSIRHVLKLNGYGGPQAKVNGKSQRFKGWETLVIYLLTCQLVYWLTCLLVYRLTCLLVNLSTHQLVIQSTHHPYFVIFSAQTPTQKVALKSSSLPLGRK